MSEVRSPGRWRGIDAYFGDADPDPERPRVARPPTAAERRATEGRDAEPQVGGDVVLDELWPGWRESLGFTGCEDTVSMDPASFRLGPPGKARREGAPERPLRKAVDAWLAAGGWEGRRDKAGSLALSGPDTPEARNTIDNQWRWEMRCRGWEGGGMVRHHWRSEGIVARMYWWTTEKAPAAPPGPSS